MYIKNYIRKYCKNTYTTSWRITQNRLSSSEYDVIYLRLRHRYLHLFDGNFLFHRFFVRPPERVYQNTLPHGSRNCNTYLTKNISKCLEKSLEQSPASAIWRPMQVRGGALRSCAESPRNRALLRNSKTTPVRDGALGPSPKQTWGKRGLWLWISFFHRTCRENWEKGKNTQPRDVVEERPWTDGLLPQVMHGHGAYNAYLFPMKLVQSLERANYVRRGQDDDDAGHTLFACPAFQLFQEDVMTTLQEMVEKPLHQIVWSQSCQSTKIWDQVATFVAMTMRHKMKLVQVQQRRANSRHQPASNARHCHLPPPMLAACNQATEEDDPDWSSSTSALDASQ